MLGPKDIKKSGPFDKKSEDDKKDPKAQKKN